MAGSIKLHKEFGLNPTISKCIICGKQKNQIALLGAGYKKQAPMSMVTEPEPCEECKKKYLSKGVMMVEAEQVHYGYSGKVKYAPTGKLAVIKDIAFKKIFKTPIPQHKIAFAEIGLLDKMGVLKKNINKEARGWN